MATSKAKNIDYRILQQELDAILASLQGDELNVEEALAAYERGMEVLKELESYLRMAENTVTKLKAKFDDHE